MSSMIHNLVRGGVALALAASVTGAVAGPKLAVEETVSFAAPPAAVWKVIGDYGALHGWLPPIASTEITKGKNNERGAVRLLTTKDGAKITEELLAYDGKRHSMRYRFLESPMPITDYVATLSVKADGKGSRIVWKSTFKRTADIDDVKAKELIAGIYRAGFDGARERLGESAKH